MTMSLLVLAALATSSAFILKGNEGKHQVLDSDMSSVNPIRKIVGMLSDMRGELERERDQEGEIFEKAMCACEGGEKDLNKVIEDSTAESARLKSQIEDESAQQAGVKQALQEHYANKASATQDLQKATDLREKESAQFSKESKMQKFSVGALAKSIPLLAGGASAASLMQSDDDFSMLRRVIEVTHYINPEEREMVLSFMDDGLGEVGGAREPSASVAEVVGVLKNMKDTMAKDLAEQTAAEKTSALGYGQLKAAKEQEISAASEAIIAKEKRSGSLAVSLTTAKDAFEDAEKELDDASKYLKALTTHCETTKSQRATRINMRAEEISAISEAIKILTDDDALETFKKAIPSASLITSKRKTFDALVQFSKLGDKKKKSLLQTATSASTKEAQTLFSEGQKAMKHPGLFRARNVIDKLRKQHPSKELSLLLTTISGAMRADTNGPAEADTAKYAGAAEKVVGTMVDDMVHVLHDDDVEDEHKKEWCANETEKVNTIKAEKQELVDQTSASIEQMTDEIAQLTEDIKVINEEIAANDKEVYETSELRKKEHQEFVDTFSTLDTARRLIDKAATRLHKFYNPKDHHKKQEKVKDDALREAGLKWDALLQKSKVAPPVIPETPGTYKKQESGGVLGLMAEMKEELTADMTESETEEKFSAKDYARMMKEAQETRALDVKRLNGKKSAKADLEDKLLEAKDLRKLTLDELNNIQLYMVQLSSECDFLMRNFEARHEGRVSEEVGLEDAKTIVTDEQPPTHAEIAAGFDAEKGHADVDEHFPEEGGHIH
jgi:hypothetical protein